MSAKSGHKGRIKVNSTVLRSHRWSVNDRVEDFDVTTFENLGFGDYIPGLRDGDISFDAYWDPVDNPFSAPLSLVPGTFASSIQLFIDKGAITEVYSFGFPLIVSVNMETATRMATHYSVTAKGAYTIFTMPSAS